MRSKALLLSVVLALLLGACSEPVDVDRPPDAIQAPALASPPIPAELVTATPSQPIVTWYVRSSAHEQRWENETVIPTFERAYPDIKINLVVAPWADFDSKMEQLMAAGAPPDIWSHWGPSGFQDYVQRGLVADLTPFIKRDKFDLGDFIPSVLDIYTVDGKIMGLPLLATGSFIFYNKDAFTAAGVDYPPTDWGDKTWTWDALLEKARALTKNTDDPAQARYGLLASSLWPNDAWCWMWGQDLYPESAYQSGFALESYLDRPGCRAALQARQDVIWKLHYEPNPREVAAMSTADPFKAGRVAMTANGGWGWWDYGANKLHEQFKWGAAALPWGADGRRDVLFTDPWLLSSQSKHPQEAWVFLEYLASAEIQRQWMELTGAPPVRKSLAKEWYQLFPSMKPEEVEQVYLGALEYGRESPNHRLVRFDRLDLVVRAAFEPVSNNEKTAAEALPDANQKLTETLRQIAAEYRK